MSVRLPYADHIDCHTAFLGVLIYALEAPVACELRRQLQSIDTRQNPIFVLQPERQHTMSICLQHHFQAVRAVGYEIAGSAMAINNVKLQQ